MKIRRETQATLVALGLVVLLLVGVGIRNGYPPHIIVLSIVFGVPLVAFLLWVSDKVWPTH